MRGRSLLGGVTRAARLRAVGTGLHLPANTSPAISAAASALSSLGREPSRGEVLTTASTDSPSAGAHRLPYQERVVSVGGRLSRKGMVVMPEHGTWIVSSRTLIAAGLCVVALLVAVTTLSPRPPAASASDGDVVYVGQTATGSSGAAAISVQASSSGDAIDAAASGDLSTAVYAHNDGKGVGVYATSSFGHTIVGDNSGSGDALRGLANSGSGVFGYSASGAGVYGKSSNSSGVYGLGLANGAGVFGDSVSGPGVEARSGSGPALVVHGRVQLSTAGRATVKTGARLRKVTGVSVGTNSEILVTLMGNAGVYVKYAYRTSATSFTVVFSGKATRSVPFAYFVVN
jgi:hypothetical protein